MKNLLLLLNSTLLVAVALIVNDEGVPSTDEGYYFLFFLLLVATPLLNLRFLLVENFTKENFFSMFLKRKMLEEKSKIKKLEEL